MSSVEGGGKAYSAFTKWLDASKIPRGDLIPLAAYQVLEARIKELGDIIKYRVIGWREHDWPEGFDRRTAQLISDYVQEELLKGEGE